MVRQPPNLGTLGCDPWTPIDHNGKHPFVVPPISDMMKSCRCDSHLAPTRLAAGPEKHSFRSAAIARQSALASDPSPRTIIKGQEILRSAMALRTAVMSCVMRAISRALSHCRERASRCIKILREFPLKSSTGFASGSGNSVTQTDAHEAGLRTANVDEMA